jgi:hypothetical protein
MNIACHLMRMGKIARIKIDRLLSVVGYGNRIKIKESKIPIDITIFLPRILSV